MLVSQPKSGVHRNSELVGLPPATIRAERQQTWGLSFSHGYADPLEPEMETYEIDSKISEKINPPKILD